MKIIALEEHVVPRPISEAWIRTAERQDRSVGYSHKHLTSRLEDLDHLRLSEMADCGIDMQVLSLPGPAFQNFEPNEAIALAREFNDSLASTVARRPDKFEAFASLPMPSPEDAASELERAVQRLGMQGALLCGRTGRRHMDDRSFDPVYATAERLRAPLYIHPQMPPADVMDAYYTGFEPVAEFMLATAGIGWHYEAGLEFLRMIMGGVFDRFPNLQVMLGHWGEVVLFYLDRIALLDKAGLKLERPLREYFQQNAYYTPSGIFSQKYLQWTIAEVGVERIIFSQDYPYQMSASGRARAFLEEAVISQHDKEGIAHRNWENLTRRIIRQ
ncbi:amidohydrolase family protein [Novosphingobium sp. P6W]|uniref:amidohydrolase family protein n=1 Tax=Novosphingobium sp. P6W TaxID=1609758 RepID=UPI0005C30ECC|nr:amidohydrolase family protein [Novosphingobium sp. P6W]AXB78811.1 amidohydrolase [Novosphingobium sp. P6W]KIS29908.1 amidohydrolase [Novosphingobium sp. P6W]